MSKVQNETKAEIITQMLPYLQKYRNKVIAINPVATPCRARS